MPAHADDCQDWAQLVDVLERTPVEKHEGMVAAWRGVVRDKAKRELITKAVNYVHSGGTGSEAWRACTAY